MKDRSHIYLDYAATTPLDPAVLEVMEPYFSEEFGNPGSIHTFGQRAQAAVDRARSKIARFFGADPREIIFTGSATEANNLAIRGVVKGVRGKEYGVRNEKLPHIVTSVIEHESVLKTCRDLELSAEAEVTYVGVNADGILRLEELEKALRPETILVSVMYANNEIGTIQPIFKISKIIQDFKNRKSQITNPKSQTNPKYQIQNTSYPLFHTDAVQAVQYLDCNVEHLGVDLLTVSAHKIYGPKGIGGLCVRRMANSEWQIANGNAQAIRHKPLAISPIITGGGQEFGLRSATENVPYIAGFAKAIELVEKARGIEEKRIRVLRDELVRGILSLIPTAHLLGSATERLPNIATFSFPGHAGSPTQILHSKTWAGEELVMAFDMQGIAVSSGSACQSKACKPSHVLEALGLPQELVASSIRFSFGRPTTAEEIRATLQAAKTIFSSSN